MKHKAEAFIDNMQVHVVGLPEPVETDEDRAALELAVKKALANSSVRIALGSHGWHGGVYFSGRSG